MTGNPVEHLDVVVVGAGISGIGAGRYLGVEHPEKSYAVLEAREASGGTWDLFRFPGIRSDSDLHTFGYEFAPWRDKEAIASAPRILTYVRETARETGVEQHIRYHHRVLAAAWSSQDARWLLDVERTDTGEQVRISAGWIFCGSGYYRYDEGFTPHFEGRDDFEGTIVHPQHWPADLDHAGKRVVVIGSGATAVTLVPALAETAAHVTLVQRTPSYILPVPREDALARVLTRLLGTERGYAATRAKNTAQQRAIWLFCQRFPKAARRVIRAINAQQLPEGYPVDEHFNPPYDPWDQRLCVVPDADLFQTISRGEATMVTDTIVSFTRSGLLLESGRRLEADVIVTATGLNLQVVGGISLSVDGSPVKVSDTLVYRGTMLSGVPNFSLSIGYTNASWTLKVGLLCEYLCRLLAHLDEHGYDAVRPVAPEGLETRPLLDFAAGYVQRSIEDLPRQGPVAPWLMSMSYYADRRLLREEIGADGCLRFTGPLATV